MQTVLPQDIQNAYRKSQYSQDIGAGKVLGAIRQAAASTGVDFAYLLGKAKQESGFNPSAKASTSSATGLYQFINQTWLQMVKDHGSRYGLEAESQAIGMKNGKAEVKDPALREKILNLRHDPVLSAAMAAEFTRDNKDHLDASVGGTIGSTELYLAHFLGAGGAEKFLKAMRASPDAPAAQILPEAANANNSVFYSKSGKALSLQDIYDRFAAKFSDKGLNQLAGAAASPSPAAVPQAMVRRDFAEYSADFYQAPPPAIDAWRQSPTTSDTLFNVMIMAQTSMNESLQSFTAAHKNERRAG